MLPSTWTFTSVPPRVGAHRLRDASHVGHKGCSFFGSEVGEICRMLATPNGRRNDAARLAEQRYASRWGVARSGSANRVLAADLAHTRGTRDPSRRRNQSSSESIRRRYKGAGAGASLGLSQRPAR